MKQLGVALVFALLAGSIAAFILRHRDQIFAYEWAKPYGKLEVGAPPALVASARDLAESKNPGKACVVEALAHDERYLYTGLGCLAGEHGDHDLRAARFRYSGDRASDLERASPEAYANSVHRLFPREAYGKLWEGLAHSAYLSAVTARAKTK